MNLSVIKNNKLIFLFIAILGLVIGLIFLWAALVRIPDFGGLENRKIIESTKIYDKTGNIILYDVFGEIKRTYIPFNEIPRNLKNASVAVEDHDFYQHRGISFISIIRAFFVNLKSGGIKQGGSTITQQLIKNSFLTSEQTLTRKVKEAILALKVENKYTKDEILNFYLNEIPYGSNNYGVEAAGQSFFGKHAKNLTLAESAYLAALPKAPTFYSPYGEHRDELEKRKNFVLQKMKELNYISEADYNSAKNEKVNFIGAQYKGIKAPHFVMYVRDELVKKYGEETVEKGGLKVITTIDYELQEEAEKIVANYTIENEKKFNAKNAGLAAIDPKTGQILVMVGSRDYFNTQNEGNFNVTTAKRQPGSSFKPFVYAAAFQKGYTPETTVFDLQTNFSVDGAKPYIPKNYDNIYRGPVTFRNALAQSINVPAVKALYLTGLDNSIRMAQNLGITTLVDKSRYGLSLVLGGGEVKLLEMTGAYATFANNGLKNEITSILEVRDRNGNILETFRERERKALDEEIALEITDILSDNSARAPAFGENSYLYFPGKDTAAKTGTTNNYRDAWVIGYTPNISVGVWAGNNDNSPMEKKVAGFIAAPMWHAFMEEAFKKFPDEKFKKPMYPNRPEKPVLNGEWRGSRVYRDNVVTEIHSILYWVDKDNPRGPIPENPQNDSQFYNWENPVRAWTVSRGIKEENPENVKKETNEESREENWPKLDIKEPKENSKFKPVDSITLKFENNGRFEIKQIDIFLGARYITSIEGNGGKNYELSFSLNEFLDLNDEEKIILKVYDIKGNSSAFEKIIKIDMTD